MAKPGPKPKPAALKLAQGNPGKRKVKPEPGKPLTKPPTCPKHLNEEARKEWRRVTKWLTETKVLHQTDLAAVEAYVMHYAMWKKALEDLDKYGLIVASPNGMPIQSPIVSIINNQSKMMQKYLAEFGMTPSARTRIEVPLDAEEHDPLKALMEQMKKNAG